MEVFKDITEKIVSSNYLSEYINSHLFGYSYEHVWHFKRRIVKQLFVNVTLSTVFGFKQATLDNKMFNLSAAKIQMKRSYPGKLPFNTND